MVDRTIFNTEKTDYETPSLFLGQAPGLVDTVNKQYPKIWELYKALKELDWDENEFDYSPCNAEFKSCSKSTYEMMIKTLAWQWEADSIASRSIAPTVAPFVNSSELWAAWQRISDNETIHAATYSEIVRNSFDDPSVVLDEVLRIEQSFARLEGVSRVFSDAYTIGHKYALGMIDDEETVYDAAFMLTVGMLILERLQFMASFAVTFAICDSGMFQPIGKAVQKIAQDELEIHVELDKAVIRNELKTPRGRASYERNKDRIKSLIDEVVNSEFAWIDYLFSEGRELVGINENVLKQWTLFCARDVYNFMDVKSEHTLPRQNPLRFMANWLDISKTQASPQEQENNQYKMGIVNRSDRGKVYDTDF